MSAEDRRKRVLQRHKGSEKAADMMQVGQRNILSGSLSDYLKVFECEPGEDGEAGTINMEVTADMSRDQVVDRVRDILQLC